MDLELIPQEETITKRKKKSVKNVVIEKKTITAEIIDCIDVIPGRRRVKNGLICRLCHEKETRIDSRGKPIWTKDKDCKGNITGYFLCYRCRYECERICYRCGNNSVLGREYDLNGFWTGKYICYKCNPEKNRKIKKKREKEKQIEDNNNI